MPVPAFKQIRKQPDIGSSDCAVSCGVLPVLLDVVVVVDILD